MSVDSPADMLRVTLYSLLLAHLCLSAPQVAGSFKVDSAEARPPLELANPFGSSTENRKLLRGYILAQVKEGQGLSELTWEQDVFSLFSLHDYDRSGRLDGLEMMKLLSDFNTHNAPATDVPLADSVVSMVDFILQTQDPNQDGLLAPSELLSPPKEPELKTDMKLSEPNGREQVKGEEKEMHAGGQGQLNQPVAEKQIEQEELQKEQEEPHVPESPAGEQDLKQPADPVHQGQSEM